MTSEAFSSLGLGGVLITLAFRRTQNHDRCDRSDLEARTDGWLLPVRPNADHDRRSVADIIPLIVDGSAKPIVERVYPFGEAGEALRHLIEDRPIGKVVLAG